MLKKYKLFLLFANLLPLSALAAGVPTSFTYQGKALNAAGTAPLTTTVSFTLSITDPSGACILYQETQPSINLSTTNGLFALQVGSAIGASKRTASDPGLALPQLFANAGNQLVAASGACTSGYTPAANDVRKLHVIITPAAGSPITVTPDLTINTVPNAMVAETLQGLTPANLTPPGSVLTFAGNTCPTGYLNTDGSSYSTTTYAALYSAIGTTYGSGTGVFNVPNTNGLFIRSSGSQTVGGIGYGTSNNLGVIQSDQMQGHYHALQFGNLGPSDTGYQATLNAGAEGGLAQGSSSAGYSIAVTIPVTDGTNGTPRTGLENRPVNIALKYCIKY
jgi:microcystin-dependent protein